MNQIEFLKQIIPTEFPLFSIKESDGNFEVLMQPIGNEIINGSCVLAIREPMVYFYEIIQFIPWGNDQVLNASQSRYLKLKDTTNLMLYFSLRTAYDTYKLLILKYKQHKEELAQEEIAKDF